MVTDTEVRRPRALAVARAVAYVAAAIAMLVLFVLTLLFLAFLGALGVLSAVVFDATNGLVVTAFGAFGLLVCGVVAYSIVWATRRADEWLVETARGPDPLDEITARYVDGEIDEVGLERDIERVVAEGGEPDARIDAGTAPQRPTGRHQRSRRRPGHRSRSQRVQLTSDLLPARRFVPADVPRRQGAYRQSVANVPTVSACCPANRTECDWILIRVASDVAGSDGTDCYSSYPARDAPLDGRLPESAGDPCS